MEPLLGEIRMVAFGFAPVGWASCRGQLIPIQQNPALFSILGVQYGGNGQTTFALPNLVGRMPLGVGSTEGRVHVPGEMAGSETVTLESWQLPAHTHTAMAVDRLGESTSPSGASFATARYGRGAQPAYAPQADTGQAITNPAGSNMPHNNLPPYLDVHFIIALQGVFPSRP